MKRLYVQVGLCIILMIAVFYSGMVYAASNINAANAERQLAAKDCPPAETSVQK